MKFKQWLAEFAQPMAPAITMPSQNPTGDQQNLQKAVQTTLQDPKITQLATQGPTNPQTTLKGLIPIAQNALKKPGATGSSTNITPMDVTKAALPQIQMPKQTTPSFGAKPV